MLGVPVWTAWRFGGGDSGGGPRICNGPIVEAIHRGFRPILTLDTARDVEKHSVHSGIGHRWNATCFTKLHHADKEGRKDPLMSCPAPFKCSHSDLHQTTESAVKALRSAQARCFNPGLRHPQHPGTWHSGGPFQARVVRCLRWSATATTACLRSKTTTKNGCGEDRFDSLPLSKKCGPTQAPDRDKSK
jgi:hypothetical protein